MKNAKYVVIAIACICVICAGFFVFSQGNKETDKDLTEIEKVIVKDLRNNYPKTPREVVKYYNRIMKCYYGDAPTEEQYKALLEQERILWDEDLLLNNPKDVHYQSVLNDIQYYKDNNIKLVSTDVCDSNDVLYVTDEKDGNTEVDQIAYVQASYFMNNNGSFVYTYQQYVLRQDENGRWKVLKFSVVEGEKSDGK